MLKLKLQYFGHLMQRTHSFEKTLILGKIEGGKRGQQRMRWLDGITDSMDMSLSWWWTGRPGVLQSVGSQRVGHNWGTEMYGTEHFLSWHPGNISLCQDFRDFKKHFKEFLVFWNSHLDLKSIHIYLLIVWTIYQFSLVSMSNWLDNIDKKKVFPQFLYYLILFSISALQLP